MGMFTGQKPRFRFHWPRDAKSALSGGLPRCAVATVLRALLAAAAAALLGLIGIAGSLFLSASGWRCGRALSRWHLPVEYSQLVAQQGSIGGSVILAGKLIEGCLGAGPARWRSDTVDVVFPGQIGRVFS